METAENLVVSGLRSRSRSKTPFLRSSCDRETCTAEGADHIHHKSGRKTPITKSTPVKQIQSQETITEEEAPTTYRTRHSVRREKVTSEYPSGENLDRVTASRKEIVQNEINTQYEHASSRTQQYSTLADVSISPIHASYSPHNVTHDRSSSRFGSPSYSVCSTDSSFAEQALADVSQLLDRDPDIEHLPYKLYKMAGEYWNKYPKTDYTYSPLSKDRVELAPGQIAVPNMSRRSLSNFRIQGPVTSEDELDRLAATTNWATTTMRKRYSSKDLHNNIDGSDDELTYFRNGPYLRDQRWWITRLMITIITTITTTTSNAYRKVFGPAHRYPYTDRKQQGIISRTASAAVAPFYWIYTFFKKVVTTTVTTVTETITPNHVGESETYMGRYQKKTVTKRRWWPWILLLLLPLVGYGSYYTYENFDHLATPNFTDFHIDLSEFSALVIPKIPTLNITIPNLLPNLTLPDINITLPDISDNLPEVSKTYYEYKDIVHNRMADASDYMKVVVVSCVEEILRFWRGVVTIE